MLSCEESYRTELSKLKKKMKKSGKTSEIKGKILERIKKAPNMGPLYEEDTYSLRLNPFLDRASTILLLDSVIKSPLSVLDLSKKVDLKVTVLV